MGCEESHLAKINEVSNSAADLQTKGGIKKKNVHEKIHGRSINTQIYENIKRVDYSKNTHDI